MAGRPYATGCSGQQATNPGEPGDSWSVGPGTIEEADGTIKRYFLHGNETITGYYCRNDGISESKYQSLSDAGNPAANRYCSESVGGIHYSPSPNCGYVREASRPIGVDIWYKQPDPETVDPDPPPQPDCGVAGKVIDTVTVTGTAIGNGFGVGPYSINSDIGLIAVHAGLINIGDVAKIKLKSHDQNKVANFPGSTRNGVTTFDSSGTTQGIITGVTVTNPGQLSSNDTSVEALSVSGTDAELLVDLNSQLQVTGVIISSGGKNYKVGDTFQVTSLGFGGGGQTPATLTVSSVRASTAGGGSCALDLELDEVISEVVEPCEPVLEQKQITVDGSTAKIRGAINGIRVINPFADPSKVNDSLSNSNNDFNWYESCPPVASGEQTTIGQYTFRLTADSPSALDDHTDARFTYGFSRYTDMLSGCCPGNCENSNRINWKVNSVNVEAGGDGWAVNDQFELVPVAGSATSADGYTNKPARFQVTNIEGQITSGGTMKYIIEKDVQLLYTDSNKNKVVDLVRDYDPNSTTDEVLNNTADNVISWCMLNIFRMPTDIEFQYWIRQIYPQGGEITPEFNTDMTAWFGGETQSQNQVQQILSTCDYKEAITGQDEKDEEVVDAQAEGLNCRYDRRTFFVPTQSVATNLKLKELWDFYGQPAGPSSIDDFICPRPETGEGLTQDNEPDLSDFAGMKVWRWVPCTDGSNGGDPNLGGYIEDIVPCPGAGENCQQPTAADDLATYNVDSIIYYNNSTSITKNLVTSTKTQQAQQVNQIYLDELGRPAGQSGLNYWIKEIAPDTVEDRHAVYWNRARVTWSDGRSFSKAYVKETKTRIAGIINAEYLASRKAPAEQAGLDYWVKQAERVGLDKTVADVRYGLYIEEQTHGIATEFVYGYDRMLEHLDYSIQNGGEKKKGGVKDIKNYCDVASNGEISLSWFTDTKRPPWYGSVGISGSPSVVATSLGDKIYFKNSPAGQFETKLPYASPNSTSNIKTIFENQFTCAWPTLTGSPSAGNPMPVLTRYVKVEWYVDYNGITPAKRFELQDYTSDLLQPIVGPRKLEDKNTDPLGLGGSFNKNGPDPTLQTLNMTASDIRFENLTPISEGLAKSLSFDESPNFNYKIYAKVTATCYVLNPNTGEELADLRRTTVTIRSSDSESNRYFSSWGEPTQCWDGSLVSGQQECPCNPSVEDCGTGGNCNPSVDCQSGNNLQVLVNQPTNLTFKYFVNNIDTCTNKGTAKITVRRWWPCPIFGPADPNYNSWMKDSGGVPIIKRDVPIVDGMAQFELPVNTSKDDYLATNNQAQTVDDPGSCHWYYTAYWEYDHPDVTCNSGAWQNPGCDDGEGLNKLPEVLCIQKQTCEANSGTQPCDTDCPACEQTFFVQIGATTDCGPLGIPNMNEGPYGPGINNGRFKTTGVDWLATPNFFPTTWKSSDIDRKTTTSGEDYVNMQLEAWVNVPGMGNDTLFTKGVDKAVDWDQNSAGEDVVDCDAKIKVVGRWYYKYFYNNGTESVLYPLDAYNNYGTSSSSKKYEVSSSYWAQGSTEANAFAFSYGGESGTSSYFRFSGVRPVPTGTKDDGEDKGISSVGIYLSALSSNDDFGDPKFNAPPSGYSATDFGTDNTINSPRPPWNIGTQGPGPKDEIFLVGKFTTKQEAKFPDPEWTGDRIDGCADAQVYENYDFGAGGLFCGTPGQPGSYSCSPSGNKFMESWRNYDGSTGGGLKFGCDPWKNAPDPTCAPPLSDVVLKANNNQGGVFNADWKDKQPGTCGDGLLILWYLDGVLRSGSARLDPANKLSCGESTQDFSKYATDPNKTYTAEYIIVDNNIGASQDINGNPTHIVAEKYVNFDWTSVYNDPDAKPYSYTAVNDWALKQGTSGLPADITTKQDGTALSEGDLWQVILGSASCTFQGNDAPTIKDLTGLRNPDFNIISTDESWNSPDLGNLGSVFFGNLDVCNISPCCDPTYASNPSNNCTQVLAGLNAVCGANLCSSYNNSGYGKLTAVVNNSTTAWPNIPGTQQKVVGNIRYLWEKQDNSGNWSAVSGGSGETITYVADGSRYRCTVTFDLTGEVPSGYVAKPITTTTTKVYTSNDEPTEICPDGTVKPVGQCPAPQDPTTNPRVTTNLNGPAFLLIPRCGSEVTGNFTVNATLSNNGWVPSNTETRYNYEGKSNQTKNTFSRTFTDPGSYPISASASKYWCSPSIDKPCTFENTQGGSYSQPYGRKFASDSDNIMVRVVKETKKGTAPSVSDIDYVCQPQDCVDRGQATNNGNGVRITVSAQVNNGTQDYAATSFEANGTKWNLNASNTRTTKNTYFQKGGSRFDTTAQASVTFGQDCGAPLTKLSRQITIKVTQYNGGNDGGGPGPGPGPGFPNFSFD